MEKGLERGLERGWQKRLAKVGERLAKGCHKVGEILAKIWRVSDFPCTIHLCSSRNARLEEQACDSMEYFDVMHMKSLRKIVPPKFSDVMMT